MKELKLNEEQVAIAKELLIVFEEQKDNKRVTIPYLELIERVNRNYHLDKKVTRENIGVHLGIISSLCHDELNLPYITGIVVSERDRNPNGGFDILLNGYGIKDKKKIKQEYIKAQSHKDWSKFKEYLNKY